MACPVNAVISAMLAGVILRLRFPKSSFEVSMVYAPAKDLPEAAKSMITYCLPEFSMVSLSNPIELRYCLNVLKPCKSVILFRHLS